MSELLMVCIVSLLIGAGIGSTLSVPVSNMLLSNEIENVNSKYEDISNNFGMGRNKPENIKEDTSKTTEDAKEEETANTEESENNKAKEPEIENDEKYDFGLANISEVDSIDAVVDFKVLLELLGIGISLTLLSSLATMIAISRFSPLTILKERS
jgi:putative ABC transport system permease protein